MGTNTDTFPTLDMAQLMELVNGADAETSERDKDLVGADTDARYLLYVDNKLVGEFAPSPMWTEVCNHIIKVYGAKRVEYRFIPKRESAVLQQIISRTLPAFTALVTDTPPKVKHSLRNKIIATLSGDDVSESTVDQLMENILEEFHLTPKEETN